MSTPAPITGNAALDRAMNAIHKCEDVFLMALLWALSIVVLIQVISRYVFSNSLPWTEEVARIFLVYATFIGAFLTSRSKSYISIDLISRFVSEDTRRILFVLRNIVLAAFYGYLGWLAVDVAAKTWHQELTTLPLSNGVTYAVPAFALFVLAVRSLLQAVLALRYPVFSIDPTQEEEGI